MGHIVAIPVDRIGKVGYKRTKLNLIVEEFLNSEADAVEYVSAKNEYSTKYTKYYSLKNAANRYGGVRTVLRGDKVYLVRTNAIQG